MKSALVTLLILSPVLGAACAASSPPAPAAPATTTASEQPSEHEAGHGQHHQHAQLPPALHDFHGVISPVWHSEPGATRTEKACASTTPMAEKAKATGDAELVAAVAALDAACTKDGRSEVEARLTEVHERFHVVAKIEKHDHAHGAPR